MWSAQGGTTLRFDFEKDAHRGAPGPGWHRSPHPWTRRWWPREDPSVHPFGVQRVGVGLTCGLRVGAGRGEGYAAIPLHRAHPAGRVGHHGPVVHDHLAEMAAILAEQSPPPGPVLGRRASGSRPDRSTRSAQTALVGRPMHRWQGHAVPGSVGSQDVAGPRGRDHGSSAPASRSAKHLRGRGAGITVGGAGCRRGRRRTGQPGGHRGGVRRRLLVPPRPAAAAPATAPAGSGYSITGANGAVYAFIPSAPFTSTGALSLNKPVVGIAGTTDAGGYWQVAGDGGVFAKPDATFHGSLASTRLNARWWGWRHQRRRRLLAGRQ